MSTENQSEISQVSLSNLKVVIDKKREEDSIWRSRRGIHWREVEPKLAILKQTITKTTIATHPQFGSLLQIQSSSSSKTKYYYTCSSNTRVCRSFTATCGIECTMCGRCMENYANYEFPIFFLFSFVFLKFILVSSFIPISF